MTALGVGGPAKSVYRCLADYADERGASRATVEQLVEDTEFSRATVFAALKTLTTGGFVARERVDGRLLYVIRESPAPGPEGPAPGRPAPGRKGPAPAPSGPAPRLSPPRAVCTDSVITDKETNKDTYCASALDALPAEKPKRSRAKAGSFLPEGFALTDQMRAFAIGKGMPAGEVHEEFEAFCDYHGGQKATVSLDWSATWRTWCRNYVKYGGSRRNGNKTPPASNGRFSEVRYT